MNQQRMTNPWLDLIKTGYTDWKTHYYNPFGARVRSRTAYQTGLQPAALPLGYTAVNYFLI